MSHLFFEGAIKICLAAYGSPDLNAGAHLCPTSPPGLPNRIMAPTNFWSLPCRTSPSCFSCCSPVDGKTINLLASTNSKLTSPKPAQSRLLPGKLKSCLAAWPTKSAAGLANAPCSFTQKLFSLVPELIAASSTAPTTRSRQASPWRRLTELVIRLAQETRLGRRVSTAA